MWLGYLSCLFCAFLFSSFVYTFWLNILKIPLYLLYRLICSPSLFYFFSAGSKHHNMHDPPEFPSECPELSTRAVLSSKLELKGCVSSGNCSPHCSFEAFVWPPGVSLYTGASWYSVNTPGHPWMKFLCSCFSTYISLHQKPVLQLPAAAASLNPVVCFPPTAVLGCPFPALRSGMCL